MATIDPGAERSEVVHAAGPKKACHNMLLTVLELQAAMMCKMQSQTAQLHDAPLHSCERICLQKLSMLRVLMLPLYKVHD